jgi:hypothetical protein
MRTKEFNLEEALNGAKVVTRDGREVTQLTKFKSIEEHCLYGVVDEEIHSWLKNGTFYEHTKNKNDLFLVVEPKSIWVNVYRFADGICVIGESYKSKDEAMMNKDSSEYIKTIEITDEP